MNKRSESMKKYWRQYHSGYAEVENCFKRSRQRGLFIKEGEVAGAFFNGTNTKYQARHVKTTKNKAETLSFIQSWVNQQSPEEV